MTPYQQVLCRGHYGTNKDSVRAWLADEKRPDAVAVIRDLAKRGFLRASDAVELEREAGKP